MNASHRGKPILVTGSHRSGSTWVGKMLALSPFVAYIDEVFNADVGHPLSHKGIFQHDFAYVTEENEAHYAPAIGDVLQFRFGHQSRKFGGLLPSRRLLYAWMYRAFSLPRPLLKDPIAALSAEWLVGKFDMDALVIIRHPAAFVSSLLRMNWRFNFDAFLNQTRLMEDWLHPFERMIKERPDDPIEEASVVWLCIYHVLDAYIQRHPEWIVKRHEDMSLAPSKEFAEVYEKLGIPFTDRIARTIEEHSVPSNPVAAPNNVEHHLQRDSQGLVKHWKRTLSAGDVNRIREIADPLASKYYKEKDW
jgi:hypothetical protein